MSKLKVNNIEPLSGSVVTLQGSVNIEGTLTSRELRTELTQSIVLYESGSTKFGDSQDDRHQFTGSLFTSGNVTLSDDLTVEGYSMLKNDQFLTGSLFTSGTRVEFNVGWPAANQEHHLIKTAPFTFNGGATPRNYQYAAFNLDHFEGGSEDLHHSMRLYMYDSHDTPHYGTELVVSPLDVKMQVIPSSSNGAGRTGKIEVRDLDNGQTVAAINANLISLGSNFLDTDNIDLGNPSASLQIRSSNYTHFGDIKISGSIDNTYPGNKLRFYFPGEGDLPDPAVYHGMFAHVHATGKAYYSHQGGWVALATSESVDSRLVALETFSSSLDATYATDAEVLDAVSALNAATSSYALQTDLNTVTSSVASLVAATSSYALQVDLNTVTSSIEDLVAATSSYALQVDLNTVTSSIEDLVAATGSFVLTSSLQSDYLSIAELKAIVTGSADFDAFKTAILGL